MRIQSHQESRVVGDDPLAVVRDVLLSIRVLVNDGTILRSGQNGVVVVADDGELRVGLREAFRAHCPVLLLARVAVSGVDALAPTVDHMPKHSSVKGSKKDLPLLGIIGGRLIGNSSPDELVDFLGRVRLVTLFHEEQHVAMWHSALLKLNAVDKAGHLKIKGEIGHCRFKAHLPKDWFVMTVSQNPVHCFLQLLVEDLGDDFGLK